MLLREESREGSRLRLILLRISSPKLLGNCYHVEFIQLVQNLVFGRTLSSASNSRPFSRKSHIYVPAQPDPTCSKSKLPDSIHRQLESLKVNHFLEFSHLLDGHIEKATGAVRNIHRF